ncbi:MAG: hypothetical protein J07HB67_01816 [halophilic archaeon J07HB67]|nr:MAG: hypothetical protein J07HB67_01816 [halophilic archaeon J07HB67]
MNCNRESLRETIASAVEDAEDPVVTAPRGALETVAEVVHSATTSCRLVTPASVLEAASWGARGRLSDVIDRGTRLRTGSVDTPAVVDDTVASIVVRTGAGTASWADHGPTEDVTETFERLWNDADPVDEIETPGLSTVADGVAEIAGESAAAELRAETAPSRGPHTPGQVRTAIWAATASSPRRAQLLSTVSDAVDVSERTVRRRLDDLTDTGMIKERLPPGETEGTDGRSSPVVERVAEPPLVRRQRAALVD